MTSISRRGFGGLFVASALGLAMPSLAFGAVPKVVVICGGAGGATAARYIAKDSKGAIDVTGRSIQALLYLLFLKPISRWLS
mgnify:CR=1 FL=1